MKIVKKVSALAAYKVLANSANSNKNKPGASKNSSGKLKQSTATPPASNGDRKSASLTTSKQSQNDNQEKSKKEPFARLSQKSRRIKKSTAQQLVNKIKNSAASLTFGGNKPSTFQNKPLLVAEKTAKKQTIVEPLNSTESESSQSSSSRSEDITFSKHSQGSSVSNHGTLKMPPYMIDSRMQGFRAFQWLIHPYSVDKFFDEIFERKPLLIKRKDNDRDYFKGIFSSKEFDKILREHDILFNKNIDVTSYANDERKTLNPDGRAYAPVIWDNFQNGCSIRFLNPQTYSRSVWKLNSILQEFFGSFVGANVYLTPPGTQGFAPHYDDIEAFILQLEGTKKWKVYKPLDQFSTLPRYSSGNFKRAELGGHDPLITVELKPGDILYFPRGYIHEAAAIEEEHSMHITLSTYQKNTYGDLMERLLPQTLQSAIESDISFRQSLPTDYMTFMGVANQDMDNPKRDAFMARIAGLMSKLLPHVQVDSAVDQMAKGFIHDSLPPVLNDVEKSESIYGAGERWCSKTNQVVGALELEPESAIKLIRYGMVRVVMEEDSVRLYHSAENSREYHEKEQQYVDIGAHLAPGVDFLLRRYPEYVSIEELPLESLEDKMEISNLLYDKGLVMVIQPDSLSSSEGKSSDDSESEMS